MEGADAAGNPPYFLSEEDGGEASGWVGLEVGVIRAMEM